MTSTSTTSTSSVQIGLGNPLSPSSFSPVVSGAEKKRRLAAVMNPKFKLDGPKDSNIITTGTNPTNMAAVPSNATNVDVLAGVTYERFYIEAASGLGINPAKVKVKMFLADKETTTDCETGESVIAAGGRFDGATSRVDPLISEQLNQFVQVR